MANPQKENGYSPIANELMEALAKTTLTVYEYKALIFILRKTYGFQRKEWTVKKWKEFEDIGIENSHIGRTLSMLCERKMIEVSDKTIKFNKDYEQWVKIDTRRFFKNDEKLPPEVKNDEKVTSRGKKNDEKLPPEVKNDEKVTSRGKKIDEKLPHEVKNGTKKVTSRGKTFTSRGKNAFLDIAQNVVPQGFTSGTILAKETLKKERFFKENSSSSFKSTCTNGGENEKKDEDEEFFLQKKAEEILRKTLGNLYTQCVFLDEDFILIGKHEEERIERVAKRARRMIKNVKMIPEYILNGLLNYDSLYKKKKERLDIPPGLLEHEKFKQEYENTDFEAAKKELGKIFSMLDEKEKTEG